MLGSCRCIGLKYLAARSILSCNEPLRMYKSLLKPHDREMNLSTAKWTFSGGRAARRALPTGAIAFARAAGRRAHPRCRRRRYCRCGACPRPKKTWQKDWPRRHMCLTCWTLFGKSRSTLYQVEASLPSKRVLQKA